MGPRILQKIYRGKPPMQHVLLTGGAGYIGSHAAAALLQAGYSITILDNLHNSSRSVRPAIEALGGRPVDWIEADIRDESALDRLLAQTPVDAVIHFAGLKAVGESVAHPLRYYDNNVSGTLTLCQAMARAGIQTLIFSSSATVYDLGQKMPLREESALGPSHPYGWSKFMVEQILLDLYRSDPTWRIALLRYFNPVGAHPSGRIGERPNGIPNNLMPHICEVARGRLPYLTVHGNDYPTRDGTGIRDYLHVMDLVEGHLAALRYLTTSAAPLVLNLGTGQGTSVLEMVNVFSEVTNRSVPVRVGPRRPGDQAACWADPGRARTLINWQARYDTAAMCRDAWCWASREETG
ncbi:MAG: UDP-glucose 4-epimerase GalE [Gammaproteobacteria bacterium]